MAALESRQHGYDQASSAAECRSYVRHLFGLVVQCVQQGHAEPVVAASRQVAADRFGAGLDIAETGRAFNVLEEVLWHEVAGAWPASSGLPHSGWCMPSSARGRTRWSGRMWPWPAGKAARWASSPRLACGQARRLPRTGQPAAGTTVRTQVVGLEWALSPWMTSPGATPSVPGWPTASSRRWRAGVPRACDGRAPRRGWRLQVCVRRHDIGGFRGWRRDPLALQRAARACCRAIRTFPAPVVAMVHGSVWGGALDLVLSCDLVVADETATFAITAANLGLPYNTTGLLHSVETAAPAMSSRRCSSPPRPSMPSKPKSGCWSTTGGIGRARALYARAGHDDGVEVADGHSGHQGNSSVSSPITSPSPRRCTNASRACDGRPTTAATMLRASRPSPKNASQPSGASDPTKPTARSARRATLRSDS